MCRFLIFSLSTLQALKRFLFTEKRLDEQDVKNNSKIMVLRVSEPERKKQMAEEEEKKKTQDQSVQRTQKGFQILSERG